MSIAKTFVVTVVSTGSGNKYVIDGVQQDTVMIGAGLTYRFDQSDNTNNNHPLRFSTTDNGTHSGGVEYTTGVTTNGVPGNAGAYTQIEVQNGAPSTLYYYCTQHSGMGGQANTDGWGRSTWSQMDWGDSNVVETGWGRNTWGNQSWGETPIIEVTGLSATTSVGSVEVEVRPGWGTLSWGQNGWGSVESANELLPGFSLTSSLGTVTAEDTIGLTGLSATSTLNSLSAVKADFTIALTGFGLVSSLGLVSVDDHSVGLTGQSATTSLGSVSPADVIGINGLSATSTVGSFAFTSDPLITLTGLTVLAAQLGGITASPATFISPTGVSSTTSLGTVTTTQLSNIFPDGQVATTSLNDDKLILRYYGKLSPKDSTGYTTITPKNSTGYTKINP